MSDNERHSSELLSELTLFGVRLGLESVKKLLSTLGNPHLTTPVVLIAGTNGKGSTAALLASMATASGYRTGLYTSPHLETVEERIRLDGLAIPEKQLRNVLQRILDSSHRAGLQLPTYFEALTVAAWLYFAESKADIAILEVGLGGRLDATNACQPILSLITEISLDHQQHLGSTLRAISREKAGIFRAHRPALAFTSSREAVDQLLICAKESRTTLELVSETVSIAALESEPWHPQRLRATSPTNSYEVVLGLPGNHQRNNLALAIRAAEVLSSLGWEGFCPESIETGAKGCSWPGRLETISLPDERRIILDAAHNPDGARRLAQFLESFGTSVVLLFGAVDDKDVAGILGQLLPFAETVIVTAPISNRALAPASVRKAITSTTWNPTLEADLDRALEKAMSSSSNLTVICGSIFLVGPVRTKLRSRFGIPVAAASIRIGASPPPPGES